MNYLLSSYFDTCHTSLQQLKQLDISQRCPLAGIHCTLPPMHGDTQIILRYKDVIHHFREKKTCMRTLTQLCYFLISLCGMTHISESLGFIGFPQPIGLFGCQYVQVNQAEGFESFVSAETWVEGGEGQSGFVPVAWRSNGDKVRGRPRLPRQVSEAQLFRK